MVGGAASGAVQGLVVLLLVRGAPYQHLHPGSWIAYPRGGCTPAVAQGFLWAVHGLVCCGWFVVRLTSPWFVVRLTR